MFKELDTLAPFLLRPNREIHVREAAALLGISPATASARLKTLAKEGLLVHRKERMLDLYRANLESDAFRDLKVYDTIRRLRTSGLVEALNVLYIKPTIILFGSAAKGLDAESSDIDLVVISERTDAFPDAPRFARKLGRPLQFFAVRRLKDLRNAHLVNSVLNGIVLQGELAWT